MYRTNHREKKSHKGVVLAISWIGVITWIVGVEVGVGMTFYDSAGSRFLGVVSLLIAATVALITTTFWIKVLLGLLGLEALNAFMTLLLGHAIRSPSEPVSRMTSGLILILLLSCCALSSRFQSLNLRLADRIWLLFFVGCHILALALYPSVVGFLFMPVALLGAWGSDRMTSRGLIKNKAVGATRAR